MKNALTVVDGEIFIDPALVKISSGNLPIPDNFECVFEEPGTFRFTWTPSMRETHGHDR